MARQARIAARLTRAFAKNYIRPRVFLTASMAVGFVLFTVSLSHDQLTFSNKAIADNQHMVSLFVDGQRRSIATDATTVGQVLDKFKVELGRGDVVEPAVDASIDQPTFSINVYRAIPATVTDEGKTISVLTGHRAARQIAADAGVKLYPEDDVRLSRVENFAESFGVGRRVDVVRAKPIQIILAGQIYNVRTQKTTARELFAEKGFSLQPKDVSDVNFDAPLQKGQRIIINRFSQTIQNAMEEIGYNTQTVADPNQPIGYSASRQVGKPGKKLVHYVINMKDGQEIGRSVLDSKVIEEPVDTIIVRGTKVVLNNGDMGNDGWARLRFCESGGDYTRNSGNGFYGAYQFEMATWRGYAPAPYSSMLPSQAPPAIQDQAAQALYQRRGAQPWPVCGRFLN